MARKGFSPMEGDVVEVQDKKDTDAWWPAMVMGKDGRRVDLAVVGRDDELSVTLGHPKSVKIRPASTPAETYNAGDEIAVYWEYETEGEGSCLYDAKVVKIDDAKATVFFTSDMNTVEVKLAAIAGLRQSFSDRSSSSDSDESAVKRARVSAPSAEEAHPANTSPQPRASKRRKEPALFHAVSDALADSELTEEQREAIRKKMQEQQDMLKRREGQERRRKILDMQDVFPDLSEEEAGMALARNGNDEHKAIEQLSSSHHARVVRPKVEPTPPVGEQGAASGTAPTSTSVSAAAATTKPSTTVYPRTSARRAKKCPTKLLNVGQVSASPAFHNANYIYPIGYKAEVQFRSCLDPNDRVAHHAEILERDGRPVFRVTAMDFPEEPIDANTPSAAWVAILSRVTQEVLERAKRGEPVAFRGGALSGPQYFGFTDPAVRAAVEAADVDKLCTKYWATSNHAQKGTHACKAGGGKTRQLLAESLGATFLQNMQNSLRELQGAQPLARRAPRPVTQRTQAAPRSRGRQSSEFDVDDYESKEYSNAWSSVSRTERLRNRVGEVGEDLSKTNPLPGFMDPITLQEVTTPAISPYGHVMDHASWMACLKVKQACPLTNQPLRKEDLKILTPGNIEAHRSKIINMDQMA